MSSCRFCGQIVSLVAPESNAKSPCSSKAVDAHCPACTKLVQVDAQIAEVRRALLELHAQRVQILSDVNLEHDSFSRSFPIEIMSHIFQLCLPDFDSLCDTLTISSTSDVPLRLSQVCRHWRTISRSIPSLWNVMPLSVSRLDGFSFDAISDVAREWLRCSGNSLPLKVILRVARQHDPGEGSFQSAFTKITQYIPNCTRRPCFMLELGMESEIVWSDKPKILHMHHMLFKNIPHLNVHLLTHIEAACICVNDVFTILFSADHLTFLQISDLEHGRTLDSNPLPPDVLKPPFVHPNLRHLGIINPQLKAGEDADTLIAAFILDSFTFPAMDSFLIEENRSADTMLSLESLADQLRRSGAHLQSLQVCGIACDDPADYETLLEVLQMTRLHLEHLHFSMKDPEGDDRHVCQLAIQLRRMAGQLPDLRTVRMQVGRLHWLCVLKHLLYAAYVSVELNPPLLATELYSFDTLMDMEAEMFAPETISVCDNSNCPSLTELDIKNMLHVKDTYYGTMEIRDRMPPGRYPLGEHLPELGREIGAEAVYGMNKLLAHMKAGTGEDAESS